MSYIVFKGLRSDDLGVIIERLPPIQKPPRKYNTYEVEGVDGTEIDEYGYAPYEKSLYIGFKEQYLNKIYEWLSGQGKLILSDEPHLYYNAHILNQIDYEKALRFRRAKVVFFVQPYKYALGEEETTSRAIYNEGNIEALPIMTISGNGAVNLIVNGIQVCTLIINGYITLDSLKEEAYKGTALQNRFMVGEFPKFKPGENVLSFTGSVSEVKTLVRSRWI